MVSQLKEKYNIDIDTSDMDSAFDNLDDKTVQIEADGSQAVAEADDVEAEIEEIPDEHETEIKADGGNALQSMANLSLAYEGFLRVAKQVYGVIKNLSEAYGIQETADADLLSALKSKTDKSEQYLSILKKEASAIQMVTVVGDEQSEKIMTAAVNMGISIDTVGEATRGAIGLAKKFKTVGLSQETAMKGLALAYKGDFTQLQRYIPALRTATSESEKMKIVQEAMADGFRQATDEAKTQTGQMQQLENAVGDVKEDIGESLTPALLKLQVVLFDTAKVVMDFLKLSDFKGDEDKLKRELEYRNEIKDMSQEELDIIKLQQDAATVRLGQMLRIYQNDEDIYEQLTEENSVLISQKNILAEIVTLKKEEIQSKRTEDLENQNELLENSKVLIQDIKSELKGIGDIAGEDTSFLDVVDDDDIEAEIEKESKKQQALFELKKEYRIQLKEWEDQQYLEQYEVGLERDIAKLAKEQEEAANKFESLNATESELTFLTEFYEAKRQNIRDKYKEINEGSEKRKKEFLIRLNKNIIRSTIATGKAYKNTGKAVEKAVKKTVIAKIKEAIVTQIANILAKIPFPFNIPIAAGAGAVIGSLVQGALNTVKAAKGALIGGRSHSMGGTNVEAEKDELILTKGVYRTPILRKIANLLNIEAGGNNLTGDTDYMQSGGVVTSPTGDGSVLSEILKTLEAMNMNIVEKNAINIQIITKDPETRIIEDAEVKDRMIAANDEL